MKTNIVSKYLPDTNALLETFWGDEPTASQVKQWIKQGEIALSAIVIAEVLSKASSDEQAKLKLLTSKFGVLPVDQPVAEIAGDYRQQFNHKTTRIYLLDCLIAATAKLYNLTLVTRNTNDYPMTDITILNPYKISV